MVDHVEELVFAGLNPLEVVERAPIVVVYRLHDPLHKLESLRTHEKLFDLPLPRMHIVKQAQVPLQQDGHTENIGAEGAFIGHILHEKRQKVSIVVVAIVLHFQGEHTVKHHFEIVQVYRFLWSVFRRVKPDLFGGLLHLDHALLLLLWSKADIDEFLVKITLVVHDDPQKVVGNLLEDTVVLPSEFLVILLNFLQGDQASILRIVLIIEVLELQVRGLTANI